MSQVITDAFSNYWQQCLVDQTPVVLDEFVLAHIPGLDPDAPIDPASGLPPADQIVHRHAVDQRGRINNDAVAYSIVMDTTVGDFTFNTMYLINTGLNLVGMIVHKGEETKLATDPGGGQTGNSLVKSMLMEYDRAAEASQTVIDASTWQIDYAARLRGMDEDLRRQSMGTFGHAAFYGDGFKLVNDAGLYKVQPGQGYVGGLLVELASEQEVAPSAKPVGLWLDVYRAGSLLSPWVNQVTLILSTTDLVDYVDANGYPHFVTRLATINADDSVTDTRARRTLTLTGDVNGQASFNGPDSIELEVTIKDNSHGHTIDNVEGLQETLDGKAEAEHDHEIADVGGLGEALAAKRGMSQIVIQAPSGAVAEAWYPVLIHLEPGSSGTPVNIHTATGSSSLPMNFNSYAGVIGMGGWSDRGSQHAGNFFRYHHAEHAISCMAGPTESGDHVVFYVEGRGFPVVVEWPDNLLPPLTSASSITLGTSIYTPSTVDGMPAGTNVALITAFEPGSGFYSNTAGKHYGTQFRPTAAEIGAVALEGFSQITGSLAIADADSQPLFVRGPAQEVRILGQTGAGNNAWYVGHTNTAGEDIALYNYVSATYVGVGPSGISFGGHPLAMLQQGSAGNALTRKDYVDAKTWPAAKGNADIVASSYGQVGTCALLWGNMGATSIGYVSAGSALSWADAEGNHSGAPAGTWKQLGHRAVPATDNYGSMTTQWIRTDAASLFEQHFKLSAMTWDNAEHSSLTAIVTFTDTGETMPLTLSREDTEAHGRWLFALARDGEFGSVTEYAPPTPLEVAARDNPPIRRNAMALAITNVQHFEMMGDAEQAATWRTYYQEIYALASASEWPLVEQWPTAPALAA